MEAIFEMVLELEDRQRRVLEEKRRIIERLMFPEDVEQQHKLGRDLLAVDDTLNRLIDEFEEVKNIIFFRLLALAKEKNKNEKFK